MLYKYTNHVIAHYCFVFLIFSPAFMRLECDQTEILSNIITAMLRLATKASCVEYACQVNNLVKNIVTIYFCISPQTMAPALEQEQDLLESING